MRVWVLVLGMLGVAFSVSGRVISVPEECPTIQSAVDLAGSGDTVDIAPGIYDEDVVVLNKTDLWIEGRVDLSVVVGTPCWDAVEQSSRRCVLTGSLSILSSRRIWVEGLTILAASLCVLVNGTKECPSSDVTIRYCSLAPSAGSAVALGEHHQHVSVFCSSAHLNDATARMIAPLGEVHRVDTLLTCARTYAAGPVTDIGSNAPAPVVVAVIDTGIDWSLPELTCRMWRNPFEIPGNEIDDDQNGYVDDIFGWDFRDNDANSLSGTPLHWHGTAVASLVADSLEQNSPTGWPITVSIMDLRFLDSSGVFYTSDWGRLADAVDYAVANGARVINLSLYATQEPPGVVREAIARAAAANVLIVAIAGNGSGDIGPIANRADVLTVGATDAAGNVATFSNTGASLDLVSLGVDVLSLLPGGFLASLSGTSFAAPRIAGIAALHLAQHPGLTVAELVDILRRAALDVGDPGRDTESGWGLIE
ncbi:MAG: S8 family serine peptidase [Thermotogota bacterium]